VEIHLKEKLRVNIQQKDQLCLTSAGLAVLFSCKLKQNVKDTATWERRKGSTL